MFLSISAVNKDMKSKKHFSDNHVYIIFRLSDALANFFLTISETMRNCFL